MSSMETTVLRAKQKFLTPLSRGFILQFKRQGNSYVSLDVLSIEQETHVLPAMVHLLPTSLSSAQHSLVSMIVRMNAECLTDLTVFVLDGQ